MWKGFQRPQRVEIDSETRTPSYGRFVAQPFERGFGTTVGNAMRRSLLSAIEGAAITAVQIEGVLHEFASIPGVVEDVTDVILNLKQLSIRMEGEEPRFLTLDIKGPKVVKAGDFAAPPQLEIVDPDAPIATINEEGHLKVQAKVCWGRGYVAAEKNLDDSMGIGWVPIDSVHSPVRRVAYRVESARLGRTVDYERLVLEVWTNGTVSPEEAVSNASHLLKEHLGIFVLTGEGVTLEAAVETEEDAELEALLAKPVDDLELSVRSVNTLKNARIYTLRDLVQRTEKDMLDAKGFGRKSLEELQELLSKLGLHFGMQLPASGGAGLSA